MKRAVLLTIVVAALTCFCGSGAASQFQFARRETVLKWDDGVMDAPEDCHLGTFHDEVAVMFDLPEWATCITAVQAYLRCEYVVPAGCDLDLRVWAPGELGGDLPGQIVGGYSNHVIHDTTWSWVTLPLPFPIGIGDSHFHGERRAFVGFRWGTDSQMCLGLDMTPPCADATRLCNWHWGTPWGRVQDADAMVRAVVSDEYVNPVEPSTWTRVKAQFR